MIRRAAASLRGRVVTYVLGATALLVFCAAVAVLDAERGAPEGSIRTFRDAIWWALTTITTVGYGDLSPVTPTGRLVAAGLMVAGIALLGVVTASFASWLLDRVRDVEEEAAAVTRQDLEAVTAELAALRAALLPGATEAAPPSARRVPG